MFNKDKNNESELVQSLKNRITELEYQLIQVANDNGSIIIKQLPNGSVELNGVSMDNTSEVEYYNSSQATYGELTMFRVGKEAKQREMDKLTAMHMDTVDKLTIQITNLQKDIETLENKSKVDADTINMYEKSEQKLQSEIAQLKNQNETDKDMAQKELNEVISRYDGLVKGLEEDIISWKERYLKINNVTLDGTVITKYGKVLGN